VRTTTVPSLRARRRQQRSRNAQLIDLIDRAIAARVGGDEPHADWLDYQVYALALTKAEAFRWRRES
jgi:hypothetical protein